MSERKYKTDEIVFVLSPTEILSTLDSKGTLDNLPFMPEMSQYCGKKYNISYRIEKTCAECLGHYSSITTMREFYQNDVVFLDELRCSGNYHNNCQVGCMIFWKERWLKKMINNDEISSYSQSNIDDLIGHLITKHDNNHYFCQSTELVSATSYLPIEKRFIKLLLEILRGDISINKGIKSIINPLLRQIQKIRFRKYIRNNNNRTPVDVLNLQPGEIVEVKPINEILKTLNKSGQNKGLGFNYGMIEYCGKKMRVRNRLDKMISETSGEMREIKNTVILENAACTYDYQGFGCPRLRFRYWREIWLKRV